MSLDASLKSANALIRHRNVLTRDERLATLKEQEKWKDGMSVFGLPKVAHRKQALAKAEKAEATAEARRTGSSRRSPSRGSQACSGRRKAPLRRPRALPPPLAKGQRPPRLQRRQRRRSSAPPQGICECRSSGRFPPRFSDGFRTAVMRRLHGLAATRTGSASNGSRLDESCTTCEKSRPDALPFSGRG